MEEGRASRTAERVAERRAAHQFLDSPLVFRDPLAASVLPPEVAAEMRRDPRAWDRSPLSRYLRAFLAARSRFAEDELATAVADGLTQYVIVGAGFDTFAYRNPFPNLQVFEVDHPATQQAKRMRLAAAPIDIPPTLTFVPADLQVTRLDEALAASSFDAASPALFAWLGVVPYLDLPAIETTLGCVAGLVPGTAILFDYGTPRDSLGFLGRIAFDRMARRVAAASEPWKSFFAPAELRALLTRVGFGRIEDHGGDEINARYFAGRADGLRVGDAGRLAKATVV